MHRQPSMAELQDSAVVWKETGRTEQEEDGEAHWREADEHSKEIEEVAEHEVQLELVVTPFYQNSVSGSGENIVKTGETTAVRSGHKVCTLPLYAAEIYFDLFSCAATLYIDLFFYFFFVLSTYELTN